MVRQLPPWHENLSKRQVRAPKVYLRNTGLLHTLLGVRNLRDLQAHPEVGASWEASPSTSSSTISVRVPVRRTVGARTSSLSVTPSMRSALTDLRRQRLYVVHGGAEVFPLTEQIVAVPLSRIAQDVPPL